MEIIEYKMVGNRVEAKLSDGTEIKGRYDDFIGQYMLEYIMEVSCKDANTMDLGGGLILEELDAKNFCRHIRSVMQAIWLDSAAPEALCKAYEEIALPQLLERAKDVDIVGWSSYIFTT